MINNTKIREILESSEDLYDPFKVKSIEWEVKAQSDEIRRIFDGILRLGFEEKEYTLLLETKNRTAPKMISEAIGQLRAMVNFTENKNLILTLLVPYLTEDIVSMLKANKLSGIDLNGNYLLRGEDLIAIRLDRKNKFKDSKYIQDIYSKNSSIVGRTLIINKQKFERVNEVYEMILRLGGNIALSTVSKVLKELSDQMIISKTKNKIELLQREKLLMKLAEKYTTPKIISEVRLKLPGDRDSMRNILGSYFRDNWIWTGEACADIYASTPKLNEYSAYVKANQFKMLAKLKQEYEDERFFNCKLYFISENEEYVFFNSINNYASQLQTYLELTQLDKREREIAEDIKKEILNVA